MRNVCGIRSGRYNVALSSFQCGGSLGSFLILRPLVHQLLDAPIAEHHLYQRTLGLPFLSVGERKFDGVEMKTIVIGLWRMMAASSVTTRRLA